MTAPRLVCRGGNPAGPGVVPDFIMRKVYTSSFQKEGGAVCLAFAWGILKWTLGVLLLLILFSASHAWGKEAYLTDIVVTNTRDHLLLYFRVKECFTGDMKKAIDNGIDINFTFFVRLYEVKDLWPDQEICDLKVSHAIRYDSLKKVYTVRLSERNHKTVVVKDFEEAKRLMSEVAGFKVTALHNLHKGKRYRIHMMAELDKIRLPFYLHYVFFFLSLWDFETDWYTVDFRY